MVSPRGRVARVGTVSIVIPTFNDDPGHLREAVASALGQTVPVEVVVVDDGSDQPVTVDRVRVIRQDNAGVAAARNHGIRATSGEIIICLDADDALSPTYAAEAVYALADPGVTVVSPAKVCKFGADDAVWADERRDYTLPDFAQRSRVAVTSAFRRRDWETAGGYDESPAMRCGGHEDHEWWVRLLGTVGGRTTTMPTAVLHYRVRPDSAFHRGDLATDERTTRARIVARADRDTLEALLWGAWGHADAVEKELEDATRPRFRDAVWRVRRAVQARR